MKIEIITTKKEFPKGTEPWPIDAGQRILESVRKIGHNVNLNSCNAEEDLHYVVNKQPDLVILADKYLPIENDADIGLAEYFEQQQINFTGSTSEALEFDSDKARAKILLSGSGIKSARFFIAIPGQFNSSNELPLNFPLLLNSNCAVNANRIDYSSLVNSYDEYEGQLTRLYEITKKPVLVEEYLSGKEFSVAIIKTRRSGCYTSIMEIIPRSSLKELGTSGAEASQYRSQTSRKAENVELNSRIRKRAMDVFKLLKIRDFARIHIQMSPFGECYFSGVNLVPDLTSDSCHFFKAFEVSSGFSYDHVVHMLIDGGINRATPKLIVMKDYCQTRNALPGISLPRKFMNRCAQIMSWQ